MALLVADSISEKFEKPPPPKKKWIQNYLEQDLRDDADSEGSGDENSKKQTSSGVMVSSVISQFQDYIHQQNNKNHNNGVNQLQPEKINAGQIAKLLDPKKGGDKFNTSLQKISMSDSNNFSQKEIGGVVQGVISQFLNGSLNDHPFSSRSSRKRCRRHEKCPSRSHRSRDRSNHSHAHDEPPCKLPRKSSSEDTSQFEMDGGVLNLSLPKPKEPSVTFAAEDSCYSTDSQRSMEMSKSQRMYYADEALDLGLKRSDRPVNHHSNHFHAQSRQGSQNYPDGYIKPVPLSILIKSPASLSPEGSPRASPAPVNLVKPVDKDQHTHLSTVGHQQAAQGVLKSVRYPFTTSPVSNFSEPTSLSSKFAPNAKSALQHQYSNPAPTSVSEPKAPADSRKESSLPASSRRKVIAINLEKQASEKAPATSKATPSTTREIHNQLEKNRRAQLKLCFEELAGECQIDPKTKASNLTVIRTAYKVVMGLRRDERENERELAKLAQEKINLTQRLEELRRQYPGVIVEPDD